MVKFFKEIIPQLVEGWLETLLRSLLWDFVAVWALSSVLAELWALLLGLHLLCFINDA
jgi:hypothetical protein